MAKAQAHDPFQTWQEACRIIQKSVNIPEHASALMEVTRNTQAPPYWSSLREASQITALEPFGKLALKAIASAQIDFSDQSDQPERLATRYPVFHGLQKIWRTVPHGRSKHLAILLYMEIFSLNRLDPAQLDLGIYYLDAYSTRDILLQCLSRPELHACETTQHLRKALMRALKDMKGNPTSPTIQSKIDRFVEILTGSRAPGSRQKRKYVRTHRIGAGSTQIVSAEDDLAGQPTRVFYPDEDTPAAKTISRVHASQLSRADDRRALRQRLNSQAARNVVSLTDMHRLPLSLIVKFLSTLNQHPMAIVFGWLALTTGMSPKRLLAIEADDGDPHLDFRTGVMSYTVRNRPDDSSPSWMHLQLNPLASQSLEIFFRHKKNIPFEQLARNFSLHHPGQNPTLERISSSSVLHFSQGKLREIEAAYLSGDIPARLRAQAHYYSVDIAALNQKYQQQHAALAKRILQMQCCEGRFRSFLERLKPFPVVSLQGTIGSISGTPVESLQTLFAAFSKRANMARARIHSSLRHERPQVMLELIQLQHMQLYVLEQLSLGMRKIGKKTSYALLPALDRGWGSEKASATFSVERKTFPLADALHAQFKACMDDWTTLANEAQKVGIAVNGDFGPHHPLPLFVEFFEERCLIRARAMTSANFSFLLNRYNLPPLPWGESGRIHPFKHLVANALAGKIPQVLLDELLSHDRDGLDLCGPWSTASASSLACIKEAVGAMLDKIAFQPIQL